MQMASEDTYPFLQPFLILSAEVSASRNGIEII